MSEYYQQLRLFPGESQEERIINIASIPHLSPFRYPGGKTWLIPTIRRWIRSLKFSPIEIVEPFLGGGIVSLTAVAENLVPHATQIELDDDVASVWQTIITNGEAAWLSERIVTFQVNLDEVRGVLASRNLTMRERAFQTILKNRVNRGGIMAAGAGLIKSGEGGKGLRSRWYPQTLKKRLMNIDQIRDRFTFIHGNGCEVLERYLERRDCIFFIDPPYTASKNGAGKRLYNHNQIDHAHLFRIASQLQGDFLMTYENTSEVRALVDEHHFDIRPITMKNTHNTRKTELLIGRDLSWLND